MKDVKNGDIANPGFTDKYPSDDNAVDLFREQWISFLPEHEKQTGGARLFQDDRLAWFLSINPVKDKSILELGPLEGGHTYILEKQGGATVEAIEGS